MPRPRTYAESDVVEAAKRTFWEHGYYGAAISDLERETGLNRSSLYLAFGTKRAIFSSALDNYLRTFMDPLIGRMEATEAGLPEIASFFSAIMTHLEHDAMAERGCLMVNITAELAGRDEDATRQAAEFRDRLRGAFGHALDGAAGAGQVEEAANERRAFVLAASTLGVWLSARIDPGDAARLCRIIGSEVESWRLSPSASM
jgi:TetR/AcrR family transcriptional regulator, transcriptional repressor for nem operon